MTSPLSFMIGLRPTGLTEFVDAARPAGLYGLNNCPVYPGVQNVLRVQDNTWGRLPDACGVDRYFETQDPIGSAEYELIGKTQYIPNRGYLTLIEKWKLDQATWYAPYNEWALDQGPDSYLKADWMNAWTCRALEIAHGFNLKLCIGSFATGNPSFELLPRLYPMLRLAKIYGGILDLHEYGVEGALMSSPSSGALRYRELYAALPAECPIPIVISEFWWGNGFEQANVAAQIEDAREYGLGLGRDKCLLWVTPEKAVPRLQQAPAASHGHPTPSKPSTEVKPHSQPPPTIKTDVPLAEPESKEKDSVVKKPLGSLILSVKLALMGDSRLFRYEIEVGDDQQAVTLTERVSTEEEKAAATEIAQAVQGVKAVVNKLAVDKDLAKTLLKKQDEILTNLIKEHFSKSATLKAANFDVKTEDGVVQLNGTVRFQVIALEAAETARQVPGVRAVNTEKIRLEGES